MIFTSQNTKEYKIDRTGQFFKLLQQVVYSSLAFVFSESEHYFPMLQQHITWLFTQNVLYFEKIRKKNPFYDLSRERIGKGWIAKGQKREQRQSKRIANRLEKGRMKDSSKGRFVLFCFLLSFCDPILFLSFLGFLLRYTRVPFVNGKSF